MALDVLQGRIYDVLSRIGENFVGGLADFVVVLLFLGIGYIVARFLASLVKRGLHETRLERKLAQKGLDDALMGFTFTDILTTAVKIGTFAIFLGIAANVTNVTFLSILMTAFVNYLPGLFSGVALLVIALFAGDYVADRLRKTRDLPFPQTLSVMTKIFVGYTALVIALPLILPSADVEILRTFFTLLVGAFALAVGLGGAIAIGFGMKDTVSSAAKDHKNEIKKLLG